MFRPMLFVHGDLDQTISFKQMELMQARAQELGAPMEFMTIQNAGHGWKQEVQGVEPSPSEREIVSAMVGFIEQQMNQ